MDKKDQVIAALTQSLEAEPQLQAIGFLEENIDANSPALDRVAERIAQSTPAKRRQVRIFTIIVKILALASIVLMAVQLPSLISHGRRIYSLTTFTGLTTKEITRGKSPEGTLLLYGDPTRIGKANQMRALWESDPSNPAYFADYSLYYLQEHSKLPPDFLITAEKIDPDNAWFTCLAAGVTAKDCVKKGSVHPRSAVTPESLKILSYEEQRVMKKLIIYDQTIIDEKNAQAAFELWKKSCKQPRYTSYQREMYEKRFPHLEKANDFASQYDPLNTILQYPSSIQELRLYSLLEAMMQKADTSSADGKQLIKDLEMHLEKYTEHEPFSLMDALVMRASTIKIDRQIAVIDTAPLDAALVARWQQRSDRHIQNLKDLANSDSSAFNDMLHQKAGILQSLQLPMLSTQSKNLPPVTEELLTPMRYVDHYFVLRMISLFTVILLFLLLHVLFFQRKLAAKMISLTGKEISQYVPLKSYVVMIVCSILLPLAYYLILYFFTPMGGRQWSIQCAQFLIPALPFFIVLLIFFSITILLARKAIAPFRDMLLPAHSGKPWPVIWMTLALIPLHLLCLFIGWKSLPSWVIAATCFLAAPLFLWFLGTLLKIANISNPQQKILSQVQARLLITSASSMITVLYIASLCFHEGERYWFKHDRLTDLSPNFSYTRYEADVSKIIYQDILEIRDVKQ